MIPLHHKFTNINYITMKQILLLCFICVASFSFAQDYTVSEATDPIEANGDYTQGTVPPTKDGQPWYENANGYYLFYYKGHGTPPNPQWVINTTGSYGGGYFYNTTSLLGEYTGSKNYSGTATVSEYSSPSVPVSLWAVAFAILLIGSLLFFRYSNLKKA